MTAEHARPHDDYSLPPGVAVVGRFAVALIALGAVGLIAGVMSGSEQVYRSYLTGFLWTLGFSNGCLGLLLLHHLTRGAWGVMIRRILEAGTRTIPFLAVAFVPIWLGRHHLYEWTHAEVVAKDPLLRAKAAWWLNEPFFFGRAALYFAIWIVLATLLNKWSKEQDETGDLRLAARMQRLSAAGIILFILTTTFAAFDWIMSLTPHWFSTIYGLYTVIGQAATAMALVSIIAVFVGKEDGKPGPGIPFQRRHLHDYGKLLFAFVCVWAYFGFSQFVIIWSGNLPEETTFFVPRMHGAWKPWSILLVLVHYVFPFAILLSAERKKSAKRLAPVAALVLVARFVDLHWLVAPAIWPDRLHFHFLDVATPLLLGGVWLWLFTNQLGTRPLIPVKEPFLQEALAHE